MNFNNHLFAFAMVLASAFVSPAIAEDNADIRYEFTGNTLSVYPNTKPIGESQVPQDIDVACLSSATRKQVRAFTCDSTKPGQEKLFLKLDHHTPVSGETTWVQYQITIDSTRPTINKLTKKEEFKPSKVGDVMLFYFFLPALALFWEGFFSAEENKRRTRLLSLCATVLVGVAVIFAAETTIGSAASIPLTLVAVFAGIAFGGIFGFAVSILTSIFVFEFSTVGKSDEFFMILAYLQFLLATCFASFALRELTALFIDREIWIKRIKALYLEYRQS